MGQGLRSKKLADEYVAYRKSGALDQSCVLCDREPIKSFNYWKIIKNDFPYDLIAKTHHMIVPLRHIQEADIAPEEWAEFKAIKANDLGAYEYIIETTNHIKSIPTHFHLHLIDSR